MLPENEMQRIYSIQQEMQEKFRNTPREGKSVVYMGKEFVVYPTVFWPSQDSIALVQSLEIKPGDRVLDLCTGSGVIAIFSALYGAKKVVALDINPEAIRCTRENARRHNLESVIDARVSDMFSALGPDERFDVITMNPPFTPHRAKDYAEMTVWDERLKVHRTFFKEAGNYLAKDGRMYISHSNFGAIDEMKQMASDAGFTVQLVNKRPIDELRTFYAFRLERS